jgi:ferredoxin--NADP+ reductase
VRPEEAELDPLSAAWLAKDGSRSQERNVRNLQEHAAKGLGSNPRKLRCRFLVAPVELRGTDDQLRSVRLQHMSLGAGDDGTPRPKAREPFEAKKGIVPNVDGRVVEQPGSAVRTGHYCAGWCKRGPTGLIGTNSLCAKATVESMRTDHADGRQLAPTHGDITQLLQQRGIDAVTWADWQRLDAYERQQGEAAGKVRQKVTDAAEMLRVLRSLRG